MLSAFRKVTKSRIGLIAVFIVLGVIALAFAAGDVTGLRPAGGGGKGNVVARVGDRPITDTELQERIDVALGNLRRQGRSVSIQEFLEQGGLEMALEQTISSVALEAFARQSGIRVSTALIDGDIASNPVFQGVDGRFDQKQFDSILARERVSPKALRDDMARDRYGQWLMSRVSEGNQIPDGVIVPYASLLLERRTGTAGLVRTIDQDPGPEPDDKALAAYHTANRARYMVPQQRVLLYAFVRPDHFKAEAAATDAEIADAYKRSDARYAATEKRSLRQLILTDRAAADAAAAEVKGGKSIAEAAAARGLEARSFGGVEKAALARETAPAIADAAFAAAQGGVVGPVRSPLGWHVLRVENVERIAARTLEQARDELAAEIAARKSITQLSELRQNIEDGIGDGRTFAELMRDTKLTPARTAPLTAAGTDPNDPASRPDPALAEVLRAAFAVEPDEREPQVVPVGQEGGFAVVAIDGVVQAAPRPLETIRRQVVGDYLADQALSKARAAAAEIVKQVDRGVPVAKALADGGADRVPPRSFDIRRADLGPDAPPQVRIAFAMAAKKAKLVEAPNRAGYYVVYVDAVEEHDASKDAKVMGDTRTAIAEQVGRERAMQFLESIKKHLKVTRNEEALARFKARLTSGPSGN